MGRSLSAAALRALGPRAHAAVKIQSNSSKTQSPPSAGAHRPWLATASGSTTLGRSHRFRKPRWAEALPGMPQESALMPAVGGRELGPQPPRSRGRAVWGAFHVRLGRRSRLRGFGRKHSDISADRGSGPAGEPARPPQTAGRACRERPGQVPGAWPRGGRGGGQGGPDTRGRGLEGSVWAGVTARAKALRRQAPAVFWGQRGPWGGGVRGAGGAETGREQETANLPNKLP